MMQKVLLLLVLVTLFIGSAWAQDPLNTTAPGQIRLYNNSIVWLNVPSWNAVPCNYYLYNERYTSSTAYLQYLNTGQYVKTLRWMGGAWSWCRDFNCNRQLETTEGNGYAATAHMNKYFTAKYYYNRYARKSWDGNGTRIINYVEPGLANAYSLGNGQYKYGEAGYGSFGQGILANLGVTTHEFTHGVLSAAPIYLQYSGESAAVHEGCSDIQACGAQYYYGYSDPWNLRPVRDLKQQLKYSQYKNNYGSECHAGGHVLAHAAYLMSTRIGTSKVAYATHYAMKNYLRSTSTIKDAWGKILNAIYNLYGYSDYANAYYASYYPIHN